MGNVEPMIPWISFVVRSGRAVLLPGYQGTYEQFIDGLLKVNAWREIMIHDRQLDGPTQTTMRSPDRVDKATTRAHLLPAVLAEGRS